jgi:hypothetical protein
MAIRRLAAATWIIATSLGTHSNASGQLRPYDPIDWSIFDGGASIVAHAGVAVFDRQRASLAGTEGRLVEAGLFHGFLRTGRIALEGGGTVQRFFHDRRRFAEPYGGARNEESGQRRDSGDYRIATVVRLTPDHRPEMAALRFGTRLPTTDNRVGLERDATDFFTTIAGRADRGRIRAAAEVGVGIHGTREPEYEQSDVLVWVLGVQRRGGMVQPAIWLLGHADGLVGRNVRGNEELAEVRLDVRVGRRNWVQIGAVRGLTEFSPRAGLIATAGITR